MGDNMSGTAYMPYYPGDFAADTRDLTLAEKGAYHDLIDYLWVNGGTVKNDQNRLLAASGLASDWTISGPKKKQILTKILSYFEQKQGQISHSKISELHTNAKKLSKIRAEAGKKGGQAKPSNSLYPYHTNNKELLIDKSISAEPEKEEPKKPLTFWDIGVSIGIPRSLIGKACAKHTETAVAEAIAKTQIKQPADPRAFFAGLLKANPKTGSDPTWLPAADDQLESYAVKMGLHTKGNAPQNLRNMTEYRNWLKSQLRSKAA
jgi:uncharacterized protein YdaU (DUF1376 family)